MYLTPGPHVITDRWGLGCFSGTLVDILAARYVTAWQSAPRLPMPPDIG